MDLLDLAEVKTRLTEQTTALREIGFAADFNAATQPGAVIAGPAAFIIITGEEPFPVKAASAPMTQWVNVTVSVLVAVRLAGIRGAAGLAALVAPVGQVRAAIFAWHHPQSEEAFELAGGGVEDFDGKTGLLVYRLDFTALTKMQETL